LRAHFSTDFITFFVCVLHKFAYSQYDGTKEAQPSEFTINGTTEKQHIPDLVQVFSKENGGF
jgi:hypothetical protein